MCAVLMQFISNLLWESYSRYHGYSHGKPVYSKLHMGLHDRWNSFSLVGIFAHMESLEFLSSNVYRLY